LGLSRMMTRTQKRIAELEMRFKAQKALALWCFGSLK
jgi:hypothetical protein